MMDGNEKNKGIKEGNKAIFGDFIFTLKENLLNYADWEKNREKYEEQALELMALHNEYHEALKDEKYVTAGSILSCKYGTHLMKLDVIKDHGNWPVSGPRCEPIINGSWQQADGRVMIWESEGKQYKCALKDTAILVCQYGGWIQVVEVAQSEGTDKGELTEEQKLLIKTIYGEAANCSETSWEAVTNVIMNRMGTREWTKYDTVTKVIKNSGFDAYTNPNDPYKTAEKYLNNRDGSNAKLENLISIVLDVYKGKSKDNTNGAVLYYSPKAQAALHKKFPKSYPSLVPPWVNDKVEEVRVTGVENDDFKFYRYK